MSHADSKIDNLSNLVAIIGNNKSGKSVFMEAAVLTIYGLPWAEVDIRDGEKEGSILVEFWNGNSVERVRSKKTQKTIVTFAGKPPVTYNGIRDIEDVLFAATGFKRIPTSKGSKPISFQYEALQETEPFLVGSVSAPGLLKAVASFSKGSELPEVKRALATKKRAAEKERDTLQWAVQDVEKKFEKLQSPDWDRLRKLVEVCDKIDSRILSKQNQLEALEEIEELKEDYAQQKVLAVPYDVKKADALIEELKLIDETIEELEEVVEVLDRYQNDSDNLVKASAVEKKAGAKIKMERCSKCRRLCIHG